MKIKIDKGNWTRRKNGSLYLQIWTEEIPKGVLDRFCKIDTDLKLELSIIDTTLEENKDSMSTYSNGSAQNENKEDKL